ncbi:uncharacterized protein LOC129398065 [Pan paniscus]|uniref:uncharacterized protein LOC129398065 n=1 Tax=Pan paniscus TaxID=9597 RepID=UPI0030040213
MSQKRCTLPAILEVISYASSMNIRSNITGWLYIHCYVGSHVILYSLDIRISVTGEGEDDITVTIARGRHSFFDMVPNIQGGEYDINPKIASRACRPEGSQRASRCDSPASRPPRLLDLPPRPAQPSVPGKVHATRIQCGARKWRAAARLRREIPASRGGAEPGAAHLRRPGKAAGIRRWLRARRESGGGIPGTAGTDVEGCLGSWGPREEKERKSHQGGRTRGTPPCEAGALVRRGPERGLGESGGAVARKRQRLARKRTAQGVGRGTDRATRKRTAQGVGRGTDRARRKRTAQGVGRGTDRARRKRTAQGVGRGTDRATRTRTAQGVGRGTDRATRTRTAQGVGRGTDRATRKRTAQRVGRGTDRVTRKRTAQGVGRGTDRATRTRTAQGVGRGTDRATRKRTAQGVGRGTDRATRKRTAQGVGRGTDRATRKRTAQGVGRGTDRASLSARLGLGERKALPGTGGGGTEARRKKSGPWPRSGFHPCDPQEAQAGKVARASGVSGSESKPGQVLLPEGRRASFFISPSSLFLVWKTENSIVSSSGSAGSAEGGSGAWQTRSRGETVGRYCYYYQRY